MLSSYEQKYVSVLEDIMRIGMQGVDADSSEVLCLPCVQLQLDLAEEFPILRTVNVEPEKCVKCALHTWQSLSLNLAHSDVCSIAEDVIDQLNKNRVAKFMKVNDIYYSFNTLNGKLNCTMAIDMIDWLEASKLIVQAASVVELIAIEIGTEVGQLAFETSSAIIWKENTKKVKLIIDRYNLLRATQRHTQDFVLSSNLLLEYFHEYSLDYPQQSYYNFMTDLLKQSARMCVNPSQFLFNSRTPDKIRFAECNTMDDYQCTKSNL